MSLQPKVRFLTALAVVLAVALAGCGSSHRSAHLTRTTHTTITNPGGTGTTTGTTSGTTTTTSGGGGLTTTTSTGASTTGTTAAPSGPVPSSFSPESFTAISDNTWWLLGTAPCSSAPCTSIVRTDNSGQSFAGTPAPRTDKVNELRFANAQDGYAFSPELWTTHDGGRTWQRVTIGGKVSDLEAGPTYVYAVVQAGNQEELMRSPESSDDWSTLLKSSEGVYGLWVHDDDVLTDVSTSSNGQLAISTDQGDSFSYHDAPPSVACNFQEQSPGVIWAPCATGMMAGIWRSTDGGVSFQSATATNSGAPPLPNSVSFGAASSTVAVAGYQALYRTDDGSQRWTPVSGVPAISNGSTANPTGLDEWTYIGFTDATHGVAIAQFTNGQTQSYRLYYTSDGGQTYEQVAIK